MVQGSNVQHVMAPSCWAHLAAIIISSPCSHTQSSSHPSPTITIITGPLPDSWASMRSLRSVVLSGNLLTGTLPSEWGDMLLQYLVLDNNQLMGWLPPSWGGMSFLRVLSLGALLHDTRASCCMCRGVVFLVFGEARQASKYKALNT